MQAIVVLIYCFIGLALAIPYCWLAGDISSQSVVPAMIIQPFIVGFLVFNWFMEFKNRKSWCGGSFGMICLGLYLTPILLNGASVIALEFGYESASKWFFSSRYLSLIGLSVVVLIVGHMCEIFAQWRIRRITRSSPPRTPPSDARFDEHTSSPSANGKASRNGFYFVTP